MSSRFREALAIAACLLAGAAHAGELKVCADPNNLPFSNKAGQGFENKLAEMIAADLGAELTYTWRAWRRSFLRETLNAKACDVVMGVPAAFGKVLATRPYYKSGYAFVAPAEAPTVSSFDDPALKTASIGVQIIGDDGEGTPPAYALSKRGMIENMRPYTTVGDYSDETPASGIVDAVAQGKIDMAIVWGPVAGYFANRENKPLKVTLVTPPFDGPGLPMGFEISVGVRKESKELRDEIDAALARLQPRIDALLSDFSVPRLDVAGQARAP
jgi:mxaJ protein